MWHVGENVGANIAIRWSSDACGPACFRG
jgi:hypothetical protein